MVGVAAAVFATYVITSPVVAHLARASVWTLPAWAPGVDYPGWARAIVLLFAFAGVALALVVPALPWAELLARAPLRPASPLPARSRSISFRQRLCSACARDSWGRYRRAPCSSCGRLRSQQLDSRCGRGESGLHDRDGGRVTLA